MLIRIKNIIAFAFALLSIVFTTILVFNLLWSKPDKISIEWQSELLFTSAGIVMIVIFGLLAYGLFYSKRWTIYLFTFVLLVCFLGLIYFLLNMSLESFTLNWFQNLMGILILAVIPLAIELFLLKIKKKILNK